jgi:hypothetical protein
MVERLGVFRVLLRIGCIGGDRFGDEVWLRVVHLIKLIINRGLSPITGQCCLPKICYWNCSESGYEYSAFQQESRFLMLIKVS